MLKRFSLMTLVPIGLVFASVTLLLRISFGQIIFFLPSNIDVLALLFGLGLVTTLSLSFIIQELLRRLHQNSVQKARDDVFAEHQRFLQRLDHELKNPLTALRAGLASLALVTQPNVQQNNLFDTLDNQVLRLSQLITNLRKLAEIDSLPIEMYPIDITQLVMAVTDLERAHFSAQDRIFTISVPDTTKKYPIFWGDQDLLLLAVHNLLDNAFKYTESGDSISLTITIKNNEYLIIEVTNTGAGIAESDLPYVWEELYRGSEVSRIPGMGVGLALVRKIINQHDGETTIISIPNQHTAVTVSIPFN